MTKIAAVQMKADFANVEANLKAAERLASQAFLEGAKWVILPEFFTSAMGLHKMMVNVAQPVEGRPMQLLKDLASRHNGVVGGSFIAIRGEDAFNTFVLAFPDGTTYFHDKDQPTMWENCYYIGGTDDGVLETRDGNVGVALCWEFVRTRTAQRLLNRVDFVVGGSCWWTLPEKRLPGFPVRLHERNLEIMIETPARLARMLGVHVVHAAHAGEFTGKLPYAPGFPYSSYYLGETQIVDGSGNILERMRREDGEGFVIADVDLQKRWKPSESIPNRFWIPDLPLQIRFVWWYQNLHGRRYYRRKIRPSLVKGSPYL